LINASMEFVRALGGALGVRGQRFQDLPDDLALLLLRILARRVELAACAGGARCRIGTVVRDRR
jgi:hypothetical protein